MSKLEEVQHAYIVFLQDKLDKAESCLRTQSWWNGFSDEELKEGSEHRAKIVKAIANQEHLCQCPTHTKFEIEMNTCAVCKSTIKDKR